MRDQINRDSQEFRTETEFMQAEIRKLRSEKREINDQVCILET